MGKLTASFVQAAKPEGKHRRHADGDGLYLVCRPNGSRAWQVRVRVNGKPTDRGLGSYPEVGLAEARKLAKAKRDEAAEAARVQPVVLPPRPAGPTFRDCAEDWIETHAATWKHASGGQDARSRFERYVYPALGDRPVNEITILDIRDVLKPIWVSKPNISKVLKQHLRRVFGAARGNKYVAQNPVDADDLKEMLPRLRRPNSHFASLPYEEVAEALRFVQASESSEITKLCFRWLVLTASRSIEARGAQWREIDWNKATWTIPASRMKAGQEHRVPLSRQAVDVLEQVRALDLRLPPMLVFPSPRTGRALMAKSLIEMLRGYNETVTVHGMRSSFRTWVMEQTDATWGRVRSQPRAPTWRHRREGLRPERPIREAAGAYAAVGRLCTPCGTALGHPHSGETNRAGGGYLPALFLLPWAPESIPLALPLTPVVADF